MAATLVQLCFFFCFFFLVSIRVVFLDDILDVSLNVSFRFQTSFKAPVEGFLENQRTVWGKPDLCFMKVILTHARVVCGSPRLSSCVCFSCSLSVMLMKWLSEWLFCARAVLTHFISETLQTAWLFLIALVSFTFIISVCVGHVCREKVHIELRCVCIWCYTTDLQKKKKKKELMSFHTQYGQLFCLLIALISND